MPGVPGTGVGERTGSPGPPIGSVLTSMISNNSQRRIDAFDHTAIG